MSYCISQIPPNIQHRTVHKFICWRRLSQVNYYSIRSRIQTFNGHVLRKLYKKPASLIHELIIATASEFTLSTSFCYSAVSAITRNTFRMFKETSSVKAFRPAKQIYLSQSLENVFQLMIWNVTNSLKAERKGSMLSYWVNEKNIIRFSDSLWWWLMGFSCDAREIMKRFFY